MRVLTGVAAVTSNIAGRLRTRAQIGVRSAQENAALAAFAQTLARAADLDATATATCEEVSRLLGARAVVMLEREGMLRPVVARPPDRSEEHTSELPSLMRLSYDVICVK